MKDFFKKLFIFLKRPNLIFKIICYSLFLAFSIVAIIGLCLKFDNTLMSVFYVGMGLTFFYSVYLFIVLDYPHVKQFFIDQKNRLCEKSKFINALCTSRYARTMTATTFSLFLGMCFVAYNAFVGLHFHSIWNGSISIYYGLLVAIRIVFLWGEYRISREDREEGEKELKRAKMFRLGGILLLCVNIALIIPVTLLATSQKDVNLPMWVAIANAGYTFYKVSVCIYSFIKTRKASILTIKGIKSLNLTSAIVSLLSLENIMIITFSETIDSGMEIMMVLSAFVAMVINIWIAVSTLILGKKEVAKCENELINKEE